MNKMDLLVITTLYPNSVQSRHGIFVETRLRQLVDTCQVNAAVIAPVPWFPFSNARFSRYIDSREIPLSEIRSGINIYHPRYLVIPRLMLFTPFSLAASILWQVWRLRKGGLNYDLVDAHYYYPDGVSVALIRRFLKKKLVVTARGTDINQIPQFKVARRLILWTARKASASITVCEALKKEMIALGAAGEKIHVLRNGVDLALFRQLNRQRCRDKFSLQGKTLLSVGHLIERKGHHLVIEAMTELPGYSLVIAGDGEDQEKLENLVANYDLQRRVTFVGAVSQTQLAEIYNAVDALVLASSREGWANVLLEAMACGTPVVATSIWGTPEVVASPVAGELIRERTPSSIADGVKALFHRYPSRDDVRRYAESFSWQDTTRGLLSLFRTLIEQGEKSKV